MKFTIGLLTSFLVASMAQAMSLGLDKSSVTVQAGTTVSFSAGASSDTNSPVSISWTLNNTTSLGTGPSVSFVAQSYMNGAEIEILATDGTDSVNTTAHIYVTTPTPVQQPDPQAECSITRPNGNPLFDANTSQSQCSDTCNDVLSNHPYASCIWNGGTQLAPVQTCALYGPRGNVLVSFDSLLSRCYSRYNAAHANHPNISASWGDDWL